MKRVQPIDSVQELNVFRLLRIARNLKVKDLAEALSVSSAYINAIENGERYPSDRLLRDYAIALDVSEELFSTFKPKNNKFENILLSLLQMICNNGESKEETTN